MKKTYGPLPAWGWAVVAVGGLILAFYIRTRSSQHADTAPPALATTGGTVGPSMAPAPSGLDPATEQLIAALAAGGAFAYGPGVDTPSSAAGAGWSGQPCSGSTRQGDNCTPGYRCHRGTCRPMRHLEGGQSQHSVGGTGTVPPAVKTKPAGSSVGVSRGNPL